MAPVMGLDIKGVCVNEGSIPSVIVAKLVCKEMIFASSISGGLVKDCGVMRDKGAMAESGGMVIKDHKDNDDGGVGGCPCDSCGAEGGDEKNVKVIVFGAPVMGVGVAMLFNKRSGIV